jgi:hypothetical protein
MPHVLASLRRRIRQVRWRSRALAALLGAALAAHAGTAGAEVTSASAAAVKVAFIYNFGKFVEWPDGTFGHASHFTLCTVGDISDFRSALNDIEGRKLQGLPLQVRELDHGADLTGCHTLLIAQSEHDRLQDILHRAQPLHILTVSDMDDFAESGGVIGLLTRNGRVQFSVNARAGRQAGLSLSAELLGLARTVIGQESG